MNTLKIFKCFRKKYEVHNRKNQVTGIRYEPLTDDERRILHNYAVAIAMVSILLISPFLSDSFILVFGNYWLLAQLLITVSCLAVMAIFWWKKV